MEKGQFVRLAPQYYALAVALSVVTKDAMTKESIRDYFTERKGTVDEHCSVDVENLLDHGIRIAHKMGLIEIIEDEFGPDIIQKSDGYDEAWANALRDYTGPFLKYEKASNSGKNWLRSALQSINSEYYALRIEETDFDGKDQEWTPIPLDRTDGQLQKVTAALDEAIEQLRGDNGYSVAHPEEKRYVFDKLNEVTKRLKEDTQISWMYVKDFAIEPLTLLVLRFGKAAIGFASATAIETIRTWLKSKGITFLDSMFK